MEKHLHVGGWKPGSSISPVFFPEVTGWMCCLQTPLPGRYKGVRKQQELLTGKMLLPTTMQRQGSRQITGNLQLTASLTQ